MELKQQSITCAGLLLLLSMASAQLTYHLDANTNSYTVQTPNSQQTFTQHFNRNGAASQGAAGNIQTAHLQAAQSQPQQQQLFSTSPQQFAGNQNNGQEDINNYFRQQLELQQQQKQSEQNNLYTTYQVPQQQQQQQQQHQLRQQEQQEQNEALNNYYQQVQQAQLRQQQQQQQQQQHQQQSLSAQQPFAYKQGYAGLVDDASNQEAAQYDQPENVKYIQQQAAAPNHLQRTHFSPSNEVSHVKFSSGLASYNF